MKLTKKEKDFLIDWLSDDLDLETKDCFWIDETKSPKTIKNIKSETPKTKILRSIIKKLRKDIR